MKRILLALCAASVQVVVVLCLLNGTVSPSLAQSEDGSDLPSTISPPTGEDLQRILEGIEQIEASSVQIQASAALTDVYLMPNYKTVADIVPRIIVTRGAESLGEGYYFVSNFKRGGPFDNNSLMIVDDKAQLIYYELKPGVAWNDFKRQPDGTLSYFDVINREFKVIDSSYQLTNTWSAGNGFVTDVHDLQVLPNGDALLMIYDFVPADLSDIGGLEDAELVDLVVQRIDKDQNVLFEWNSRDYFLITDTYRALDTPVVDYAHGNAIELDVDGNYLISNRHMSEITKIDSSTGEIIWRLGGKNNQFTFINDTELPGLGIYFSYQHDIRRLPNGNITIFDNANQFIDAGIRGSRGVEYEINEADLTATLVKEFRTSPDTYSTFMGSMQRLPNGNTVIGWGGGAVLPNLGQPVAITEFTPQGDVALQFSFSDPNNLSYRGFKFPWQGFPTSAPSLVAVTDSVPLTLYYSWNGATEVASYDVRGGATPNELTLIEQQTKTDFEDSTPITDTTGTLCFFQITPISKQDAPMRLSDLLYVGDDSCATVLISNGIDVSSRVFTDVQSAGVVTTTLTILPGEVTSPTILIRTPVEAEVASIAAEPVASNIRFSLQGYEGEALSEVSVFTFSVQLAIDYGSLDLTRDPSDVELLRWDETLQSWTSEGLKLLQREVVNQRLLYDIDRPGEFALFVANDAPQSAPVSVLIDEEESFSFSGDLFPYFDPNEDAFAGIVVETLPVSGSLAFAGTPITLSQTITVGVLPSLVFTPEVDQNGLPYTTFSYRVSDGFAESEPYTFTISVRPVNETTWLPRMTK